MTQDNNNAPDYAGHSGAQVSPLPFDLIEGNEHHGPYIVNGYGADVCDFYAMSNPASPSVRNGGDSKPIWFTDAAANAEYMCRATNAYAVVVDAMRAIVARSNNGELGTSKVIDMRNIALAAIAKAEGRS